MVSFSVTEEVGKLVTGTLTLRDQTGVYSRILRNGLKFELSWGYKAWNVNALLLGANATTSRGIRQSVKCLIQTPSGNSDEGGQVIYNVTFYGLEFLNKKQNRVFDRGTRRSMVQQLFQELNVLDTIIDFPDMNQVLRKSNSIRQRENNFSFLFRLAEKFKSSYQIGYKPDGRKIAIFIDDRKIDSASVKRFLAFLTNVDNTKDLFYNAGSASNVKSYSWQHHIGENGQGDGASISRIGGKPIVTRFTVESGSVILWELNNDRVKEYLRSQGSLANEAKAFLNIANATDFQEVKHLFDPVDTPFAPQGMGFTANVIMQGDPRLTALTKVVFRSGFPAPLMQGNSNKAIIKFFIKKVTHTFNKSEYACTLQVVDTYTLTGSFIAPASLEESIGVR